MSSFENFRRAAGFEDIQIVGYLVARTLDSDGKELGQYWKSSLIGRYGQD